MTSFRQGGLNPNPREEDELTRLIREGVPEPQGFKESVQMTADKLAGRATLGATVQQNGSQGDRRRRRSTGSG